MPVLRSRYPVNWDEISREVKAAADWRCEECGAKHGETVYREKGTARWTPDIAVAAEMYRVRGYYESEVQLGVAHLGTPLPDGTPVSKADTMDCRPENLRALCRRCHLAFDLPENIPARKRTRLRRRREKALQHGQIMFWEELR